MDIFKKTIGKAYVNKKPYARYQENSRDWEEYQKEEQRIMNLFKKDLRLWIEQETLMVLTDKQFEAVFFVAWSEGHSSGFNEVANYASSLIPVIVAFGKQIRRER